SKLCRARRRSAFLPFDVMIIKEYRVLVPLALDEYRRGQLFAVAEASKNETGGGEGVEVMKREEFTSSMIKPGETISGIYTLKFYRLKSKSPWILRKLLPDGAFILREDCWNAYPYCKTILTNPEYMGNNFYIIIESMHIEDNGTTPNALNLSKNLLKNREVIMLDIYDEKYLKKGDTTPETNPRIFHSKITGRGPLAEDWAQTTEPLMCCYKVVQVLFKWRGLQTRIERLAHKQYPRLFIKFHRETFCWMDRWYDLTMDEIKELEDRTAQQLKRQIIDPERRGICADDDELPSRQHPRSLSLATAIAS
uniref:Phosphatidylinositol transfer protein n=1 Tax=Parascaris univalens TaxID=6257 RepID=A0A915ANG7_PARUN